jgi:ATP-binding cassette, subfamily B, bacterial
MSTAKNNIQPTPRPKWRERLQALNNIPPLMRMVWRAAPATVLLSVFFRVVVSLIPIAMLAVTQVIINAIQVVQSHQGPLRPHFWWFVGLEFALACVATGAGRVLDYCDVALAEKYTRYISVQIMEHASRLDLASYEDPMFYDKMERARVQGTDRLGMIQSTGRLVQQAITTVSLAAGIFFFSPWLLLGLVVCIVPTFLGETHFAFLGYSLNFQQTPSRRELDYLRVLGGSKESAKELKLFGLAPFLVGRYSTISSDLQNQTLGLAKRRLIVGSFLAILGTLGYYGAYAYVVYEAVAGVLLIGTLVFLTGAIAGASSNIQLLFSTFSSIADQALFLTDLLDFFALTPRVRSKPNALPVPRPILQGFEFKNVSFAYPGSKRMVLKNINFRLGPSERIALVGENGQGKTTIVKLLTRLYDVTDGQILLDGVDIREYDLEDLWKETGVIFQDFMRYEMTASDNIAMGRIADRANATRIQEAAVKSLAAPIIQRLPKGFEQVLGCRFDGGVDLSGGEWQRMALARAYLRDAQLLILDEPTASLDARSEHDVFRQFTELTQGKMALLISHRFSTVRMADRILVMEDGQISEEGPHDELMKSGGHYADMFELQATSYR